MEKILSVNNLQVSFTMNGYRLLAVRGASFELHKGETLGLVGESGCGKSVTAYSILRLIDPPGCIDGGEIIYANTNLLSLDEKAMYSIRGKEISMIFQEPMTSLNPVFRIGFQIEEVLRLHLKMTKKEARERSIELLRLVGIPSPEKRCDSYPHELSGGMRQRAMIAMALAANPAILIADEPTTALDVTIQAQILDLLLQLQQQRHMSLLLITHDLGIVANVADRIAIMYAGEIVEIASCHDIFNNPLHPYTIGLFEALPRQGEVKKRMATIPGTVPTITSEIQGCAFYPRCFKGSDECMHESIALHEIQPAHYARCIKAQ
ncbi:MAG: ABC transporter ATP-binding protein [Spirochaetes bacterium]|nr:ABC transporter ATP-binding protein [Spirochaetota bacterium]